MLRSWLSFALFLAIPSTIVAQAAPSLQGVWKTVERTVTGANARTETNPQPSLWVFTPKHYALLTVSGTTTRKVSPPPKDPTKLTDAEKLARFEEWALFAANAGTYEVSGSTLTTRPTVAKSQGTQEGPVMTREFKVDGNTLWLTLKTATNETRTKFTRVE